MSLKTINLQPQGKLLDEITVFIEESRWYVVNFYMTISIGNDCVSYHCSRQGSVDLPLWAIKSDCINSQDMIDICMS